MIELPLTDVAIDYGKRTRKRHAQAGASDHFQHTNKRWIGLAAEHEIEAWMKRNVVPHVWHGGFDSKPDFEIMDLKVAAKSNTGDGPRNNFVFVVPEQAMGSLADGILFSIVSLKERKVWIAGYISAWQFRRFAQKHKAGDPGFVDGRQIVNDCRTIVASELASAELFFDLLGVCVA